MKDAVDSGIKSVTQIPYFEGDFWPNVLEDCAKALDGDEEQDAHSQESTVDGDTEDSMCPNVACSEPLGKVRHISLVDEANISVPVWPLVTVYWSVSAAYILKLHLGKVWQQAVLLVTLLLFVFYVYFHNKLPL